MAWATEADVENQTGVTVTPETIAIASAMIDTFTGADEELPEDAISGRDKRFLKKATAWQAVWIAGKPGLLSQRESSTSVTSDTQAITRESYIDALCGPMARREIANLSWVGTRTTIVRPVEERFASRNFLNERSDPPWFGGEGAIP